MRDYKGWAQLLAPWLFFAAVVIVGLLTGGPT